MNTFACIKYGNKYDSIYVNNLYNMIQKNTNKPSRVICFTDNSKHINSEIIVRPLPDKDLPGWWSKVGLFKYDLFHKDDEIAEDISSFLCLFFRRLITVATKVREQFPKESGNIPDVIRDWPYAFVNSLEKAFWGYKKSTVISGAKGIEQLTL